MTVKELRKLLKNLDGDRLVVVSRDPEGNGYSPLFQIDENAMYDDGEVGLEFLTEDLKKLHFSEEDIMEDGEKAIVLYP